MATKKYIADDAITHREVINFHPSINTRLERGSDLTEFLDHSRILGDNINFLEDKEMFNKGDFLGFHKYDNISYINPLVEFESDKTIFNGYRVIKIFQPKGGVLNLLYSAKFSLTDISYYTNRFSCRCLVCDLVNDTCLIEKH